MGMGSHSVGFVGSVTCGPPVLQNVSDIRGEREGRKERG